MLLRIKCPRCGAEYAEQRTQAGMLELTCVNACGYYVISRSAAREVIAFYLTPQNQTKEEPDATED